MTKSQELDDHRASAFAGLIFANRDAILAAWLSHVGVTPDEPAAEFISDQLDASILALAEWFLGIDPAASSMSMQWTGIRPDNELVAGAVISMGLLPSAVQSALPEISTDQTSSLQQKTIEFSREMIARILTMSQLESQPDRWDAVAQEIEARYEAQRLQRIRRLGVLIDISHAVSTGSDIDTLFTKVQDATTRLSGCDYTEISLIERHTGRLRTQLIAWQGERCSDLEGQTLVPGLADIVLQDGLEFAVSDYVPACQQHGASPIALLNDGQQRAWMGAPLRRNDEVIGIIAVSCPLTSFEREDVELLAAIARQTAVAYENHELLAAKERHVSQLTAVNQIARSIADVRDSSELLNTATQLIHRLFGYGLVTIFLTNRMTGQLEMISRQPVPVNENSDAASLPLARTSIVGQVAKTSLPVRHDDVWQIQNYLATPETSDTRSEMAVPVIHRNELLGVLDVQSNELGAFDDHDLTTLQTIADQIAVGLENSRLFAEEAQRTRDLRLILDKTQAASASLLLDEVLDQLADGLAEAAETDHCLIHLYDSTEQIFRPVVLTGSDEPAGRDILREWNQVLHRSDRPELEQLMTSACPIIACPWSERATSDARSSTLLAVPLRTRKRTVGVAILAAPELWKGRFPLDRLRLISGVADSAALAVENAQLYARAHGLAIAEERGRIAQEIHDTLAQGLTAISLQLDLADSYLPGKPEKAHINVQRALELTRQNLDDARRSVLDLRAADVHQMSLPDALARLVGRLRDETSIRWDLSSDGLTQRLSARIEVGLYRIAEEAIMNVRSHSSATVVHIRIESDGRLVTLSVEDNGVGFDPASATAHNGSNSGFGLVGIRERARLLGGSLLISSAPDQGTALRVTVPYEVRSHRSAPVPVEHGGIE